MQDNATPIKVHLFYQARLYQMQVDSEILLVCPQERSPLLKCMTYAWKLMVIIKMEPDLFIVKLKGANKHYFQVSSKCEQSYWRRS